MNSSLDARLVYVAPASGGGIGDYAEEFASAVAPHFTEVIHYPVTDYQATSPREIARVIREVRDLAISTADRGPAITHVELGGQSTPSFWAMASLPARVLATATIHDAPQPVWAPFKIGPVAWHPLLFHGVHVPLQPVSRRVQRRALRGRTVFTLTGVAGRPTEEFLTGSDVVTARHFILQRPDLGALTDRPTAVGMFGYVYDGKGFDLLGRLREELDPDVGLVIAGRGTEHLDAVDGVSILGEVNGTDEDKFFASIRALLVPYSKVFRYGKVWAASGAAARALAYGVPVVTIDDAAQAELIAEGGALGAASVHDLATTVNALMRDVPQQVALGEQVRRLREERTPARAVMPFVNTWRTLLGGSGDAPTRTVAS
ncbi:hypothetical protein GCM10027169_07960 [Gordonia jinhuaensis]|uniref:Uncharacterized protein n=1 Tax=Gordonia jinhuaensis TaxID=1517702 RepID=A0A916SWY8_9ACTN|nr:glycosyltransferase [Gordonia jinhuaensis]GGB21854.1 hypothetical protein GCM10011489_07560 [Gordonia jinhuaensis]